MADSSSISGLREVLYGSSSSSSGDEASATSAPTSAVVRTMASSIYEELERMIKSYGDGVVTALVPQLIAVLEYWEKTVREKHSVQLELDLQRADLAQLLKQFEKERQLRRAADQMLLETQDAFEEERKVMIDKLSSLEKNFKLMELKSKLQADQSQRFEEKESDMRKEYEKLHSRYSELLKNYTDYVDRTKLFAAERSDLRNVTSPPEISSRVNRSATSSSLASNVPHSPESAEPRRPSADGSAPPLVCVSLQAEMSAAAAGTAQIAADSAVAAERTGNNDRMPAPAVVEVPSFEAVPSPAPNESQIFALEPDLDSEVDGPTSDDASELTGSRSESPSEDLNMRYDYGVSREFDKLIRENQELVEMKNALNTVKNDLISQLERKMAELELLRVDLTAARNTEVRLTEELRKAREALQAQKPDEDEDGETPSQRKRFTRVEMARVIYERNQYKERLVELQETVRWAEMARAQSTSNGVPPHHAHVHQKKSGFWGFFSGLFVQREREDDSPRKSCTSDLEMTDITDADAHALVRPYVGLEAQSHSSLRETSLITSSEEISGGFSFTREDIQGWNVPVSCPSNTDPADNTCRQPINVPRIFHCGPVDTDSQGVTQMWCAAFVKSRLSDGTNKDEVFARRLQSTTCEKDSASTDNVTSTDMSRSLLWISTTTGCDSKVLLFDLQSPSECIHSFCIKDQHILTIGCTEAEAVFPDKPQATGTQQPGLPDVACSKGLDGLECCASRYSELQLSNKDGFSNSLVWLAALSGWIYLYLPEKDGTEPKLVASSLLPASSLCFISSTNSMCAGLSNGTVAVFNQHPERMWNIENRDLLELDKDHFPVRCAAAVSDACVWFGCGDNIYVVDVSVLRLDAVVQVLPEKPGRQVRCLRFLRGGVWISRRLDSVLRLYDSRTLVNLQEVDIDTFLLPLSGSCLSIKNARISALNITNDRMWIGTNNGAIMSVLLTHDAGLRLTEHDLQYRQQPKICRPRSEDANTRVSDSVMEFVDMSGYQKADLPFCSIFNAQVSYHGHQAAVKFIIEYTIGSSNYVLSGGDGAIDFRCAKTTAIGSPDSSTSTGHLILWRL